MIKKKRSFIYRLPNCSGTNITPKTMLKNLLAFFLLLPLENFHKLFASIPCIDRFATFTLLCILFFMKKKRKICDITDLESFFLFTKKARKMGKNFLCPWIIYGNHFLSFFTSTTFSTLTLNKYFTFKGL